MTALCTYSSKNHESVPFYQFHYEGFENKYLKIRAKSLRDGQLRTAKSPKISNYREWFINETHKQLDTSQDYYRFEKAICIIVHGFSSFQASDLDNYDYKYVVDGIKSLQIIIDDSYKELSLMCIGQKSELDRITCYVVPEAYFIDFLAHGFVPLDVPALSSYKLINPRILEEERFQLLEESKFF
ncbi:hypothetical protein SAMN05880501_1137 [Ureibacillus xyleni]|uniref:Uncharacterized protein n=1 Tax=Ureibacillus xyleni TaxID=614648 RepID=A0A285TH98_9BACL|nr:hypothetical protein [Ureibacillus xyleni]SOC21529.1 hypothetical protein SAMN05880501_1137 [Ureibacillus xyleni]